LNLATSTLEDIKNNQLTGKWGAECTTLMMDMYNNISKYEEFVSAVFSKFTSKLSEKKFCLPS